MDLTRGDISWMVLRPNINRDMGQLRLNPTMLRVLAALNGERDVADVVELLGMGWGEIRQTLIKLQENDLIAMAKDKEQALSSRFFSILEEHLAEYLGPVTGILINDTVRAMGETKQHFPCRRASELVDRLGREITSPEKRKRFRRGLQGILEQFT
jgi:DNA-binding transcriptional ArsR family regulator